MAPTFVTRKNFIHSSAEFKAATFSTLRLMIDQERLILPASAEDLLRELLMLRVDLTPSGLERVEAGSGDDDLADALGYALAPWRDGPAWRFHVAELADPRRGRLPEANLPPGAEDLPTVPTGGGLRVPRTPLWQSPAGRELTVPPGSGLPEQPSALRYWHPARGVIPVPTHR